MTDVIEKARAEADDAATPRRLLPRGVPAVLLVYLLTRVVQFALIDLLAPAGGPSIKDRLLVWDGGWFTRVATEGYPHTYSYDKSGQMVGNGLAFFPLYPWLIRGLHWLHMDAGWAALVISWIAAGVAAVLLYRFGSALHGGPTLACRRSDRLRGGPTLACRRSDRLRGERLGYALVVLFCAQPMSVVLSMGYSEAVFSALVIGALYAAYRESFLVAGVLGLLAGLCRPTGLAVGLAVTVAAALALYRGRAGWRAPVGAVLALAGVPAYVLWVGLRVGDLNAWFTIQTAGWGTTFDWGSSTWSFLWTAFTRGNGWVQMSVAFILIAALVAAVFAVTRRAWPPLVVYGLLVLGLVVGQAGYYHSKPRLLVPAVLILLPAGYAAARASTRGAVLALTGYALFGLWYGAYMITVWPFTI